MKAVEAFEVRPTRPQDFEGIEALSRLVYPTSPPWNKTQLASHMAVFPQGQLVAVERSTGTVVGMAASLIVLWDDYEMDTTWKDFTALGMFTNHDPAQGHTLYGAEVMVHPGYQSRGIGGLLYNARRVLARRFKLMRIRAGARLRGYHRYAATMSPEDYVDRVVRKELRDPTLSFQLNRGFKVLKVVSGYLKDDPESLGYAAVIEWLNSEVVRRKAKESHPQPVGHPS